MGKNKNRKNVKKDVSKEILTASNHNEVITSNKVHTFSAINEKQKTAIKSILSHKVTFLHGAPGTGKTKVAVGMALQEFFAGKFDKIILTRPYVEAGEKIGFLPGDFSEKIAPFMMPIYDALSDSLNKNDIQELIEQEKIMVLPIAFMRGVSLNKSFVILDEAQNTAPKQMRMFLTRMGKFSKFVITGDINQSDLHNNTNGLSDAILRFGNIPHISMVEFTRNDCVRDPLVSAIDELYDKQIDQV